MTRRLRVARTERRTSAAARLRAHLLALEAWKRARQSYDIAAFWEEVALASRSSRVGNRAWTRAQRAQRAISTIEGWAAAARRWA
jgi:hypothetical protein